jgi:hypothetical protein
VNAAPGVDSTPLNDVPRMFSFTLASGNGFS